MRIKTKYNIGDVIIYNDGGLKIATIISFEIKYRNGSIFIDYELQGKKEHYLSKFGLNECAIISKATKKLIKKQLTYQYEDKGDINE